MSPDICTWHIKQALVLVCQGCHNKIPHTGWLKHQNFIFSQFQRLKIQAKIVCGLVSTEASLLVYLLTMSSHGLFSMCFLLITGVSSSFQKDPRHIGEEPSLMTSLDLNCPFTGIISKYGLIGSQRFNIRNFGETQFSP